MSVKANYFKIGIFVITTAVLLVVSIVGFARPRMKNPMYIETYMNESVAGLNVGSDIFYRGVKIGVVENIDFASSRYTSNNIYVRYVVVDMVIESDKLLGAGSYGGLREQVRRRADEGLRMQLSSNPLTGVSTLEADYPMTPDDRLPCDWEPLYTFIPSQKSMLNSFSESVQKGFKALDKVDFEEISKNLKITVAGIKSMVSDANDLGLVGKLDNVLIGLESMVSDVNDLGIVTNVNDTVDIIKAAGGKFDKLMDSEEEWDGPTINQLFEDMQRAIKKIEDLAALQPPDIAKIVDDISRVTENVKELSEEFKKNPGKFLQKPAKSEVMK